MSIENVKKCRKCAESLNKENCTPSFLEIGINICRHCNQKEDKLRYKERRILVLERMGNTCKCCGENRYNLLSIDHINGGGHKESLEKGGRGKRYIQKLFYLPDDDLLAKYQCLCFNCNYTKGFWNKCPHQITNKLPDISILPIYNRGIKKTHLSEDEQYERYVIRKRLRNLKTRLEMVKGYGGECMICQEAHPLFLTLDHINNNGNFDEKGVGFYRILKKLGYPGKGTQLQLLCHNCNASKEYTNNRKLKVEETKNTPETYVAQEYSLSDKEEEQLETAARTLYLQLKT